MTRHGKCNTMKGRKLNFIVCVQLFAHPVYEAVEGVLKRQLHIEKEAAETAVRVIVRVLYCGICAGLAMLLPFFNGELSACLERSLHSTLLFKGSVRLCDNHDSDPCKKAASPWRG